MSATVICPNCDKTLKVSEEALGKRAKCPACGNAFDLVAVDDPAPPPSPSVSPGADASPDGPPALGPRPAASPGQFAMAFRKWSLGGKLIFIATCVAVLSVFLPLLDLGIITRNGLQQGTVLLLGLYVYPVLMLLYGKPVHRIAGIACGGVPVIVVIIYIADKQVSVFGESMNAAGGGAWIFLLASMAFTAGNVFPHKYKAGPSRDM